MLKIHKIILTFFTTLNLHISIFCFIFVKEIEKKTPLKMNLKNQLRKNNYEKI